MNLTELLYYLCYGLEICFILKTQNLLDNYIIIYSYHNFISSDSEIKFEVLKYSNFSYLEEDIRSLDFSENLCDYLIDQIKTNEPLILAKGENRARERKTVLSSVVGISSWKIKSIDNTFRLVSPQRGTVWEPKTPLKADEVDANDDMSEMPGSGIHAFKPDADSSKCDLYDDVIGFVSLWGLVVEHTRGYRAEYAYPKSLNYLKCKEYAHRKIISNSIDNFWLDQSCNIRCKACYAVQIYDLFKKAVAIRDNTAEADGVVYYYYPGGTYSLPDYLSIILESSVNAFEQTGEITPEIFSILDDKGATYEKWPLLFNGKTLRDIISQIASEYEIENCLV